MRVGAQLVQQRCQSEPEFWTSFCAAHGSFHAHFESDFFELLAVLVLTVVNGMHQLMDQGVDHLIGRFQGG